MCKGPEVGQCILEVLSISSVPFPLSLSVMRIRKPPFLCFLQCRLNFVYLDLFFGIS